jgi:hypothetical protein
MFIVAVFQRQFFIVAQRTMRQFSALALSAAVCSAARRFTPCSWVLRLRKKTTVRRRKSRAPSRADVETFA